VRSIEDDFWSSVPSGDDVLGQGSGRLFIASCQAKIAHLEVAVLVEQQVGGLQIAMDDIG
jgi:hypothetical protein